MQRAAQSHRRPPRRLRAVTARLADAPQRSSREPGPAPSSSPFCCVAAALRCGPAGGRHRGGRARSSALWSVVGRPRPRPLALAHLRGLRLAAARPHPRARRRRRAARCSLAVPLLVVVQLLPSDKAEWPYLVGPEPARAHRPGHRRPARSAGTGSSSSGRLRRARAGGLAAAARLRRGPRRSRAAAAPAVDPTHRLLHAARAGGAPARRARRRRGRPRAAGARLRAPRPLPRPARLPRAAGQRGRRADRRAAPQAHARAPTIWPSGWGPTRWPSRCAGTTRRGARAGRRRPVTRSRGRLIDRHRQTLSFGCASYPPLRDPRGLARRVPSRRSPTAAAGRPSSWWRRRRRPALAEPPVAVGGLSPARRGEPASAARPSRLALETARTVALVLGRGDRHRQRAGRARGSPCTSASGSRRAS